MHTTLTKLQNQTINPDKLGIFADYFSILKVGSMLNKSGIVKTKGASPLELFTIVFNLAFIGKDAVYNFLNSSTYNWRCFTILLSRQIYFIIKKLLDNSSEEVLILGDSTYYRSRSKKVELLARVYDHSTHKYLKGFRLLTLGWSDGNSFLGIDFALLSSAKEKNRYNEINPDIDKRTCGYQRRKEAITKSTMHLEPMIKRAITIGIRLFNSPRSYLQEGLWCQFHVRVAVLFLFPETNARCFVQSRVVSQLEKVFGKNKNLQQIQNTKKGSVWHKRNGFKIVPGIAKMDARKFTANLF